MADQDEEVDRADDAGAEELRVAVEVVVDDVADEEQRRADRARRTSAACAARDVPPADGDEPGDEQHAADAVERRVDRGQGADDARRIALRPA